MCDDAGVHVDGWNRRRRRVWQSRVQRIDGSAGGRVSDRGEFRILREIRMLIADGTRPTPIWHGAVVIIAPKLVTKRTDLALKRVNLTVPAKDHASPSWAP